MTNDARLHPRDKRCPSLHTAISELKPCRFVRLIRKTPGESLGFTLKTVALPKKDPASGLPTGEVWCM